MRRDRNELADLDPRPIPSDRLTIEQKIAFGYGLAIMIGGTVMSGVEGAYTSIKEKTDGIREALSLGGARLLLAHEVSKPTREERRMNRKIKAVVPQLASPEVPLGDEE